jgi:two-component sensor histidine kinase
VSVFQGIDRARSDVANVHDRLVESARMAASSEENVLLSGEQLLHALANLDEVRNATGECDRTLADILIGVRFLTNLSRMDVSGKVICTALPQSKGLYAKPDFLGTAKHTMSLTVSGQITSPVTHSPVIAIMLPLRDTHGRFQGVVAAGVNVRWLDYILRARALPKGAVVSVFDRSGAIIATNNKPIASALFNKVPLEQTLRGGLESKQDARNNSWSFAAAPLLGNNIFVGFAMRESRLFGPTYLRVITDLLLPILMIGLAWGAIWFATERQVNQWIAYLRRIAAAYRAGHYRLRPQLENAPAEFKLLGTAMEDMAASIQDRDKSLREAIAQKTHQIRETHHRVKNNLQVVMSLLSLQAAQSTNSTVREALGQAQARINALALVHRLLNEVEDQTSVDLQRLLNELTRQVVEGFGPQRPEISIKVDSVSLSVAGEVAVPLALFTVEALANIYKHAFPASKSGGTALVTLRWLEGIGYRLAIQDSGVGYSVADVKSGIGDRLLKVFGRQVHGTVAVQSGPGKGTCIELVFGGPNGNQPAADVGEFTRRKASLH